jgi:polyhydroxyalkanoate synthesis regulator phasin
LKKFWRIAGIAALVAVVGVAALGIAVYAQEPEPDTPFGRMANYVEQVRDLIASKLGVERADLDAAETEARQEVIQQAVEDGVLTQDQADRMLSNLEEYGFGFGRLGRLGGHWGGWMGDWKGGSLSNWQWLADQFGMTIDELAAELEAGKTIAELAEEKGVDLQAAQIEAMKERIQQAVEDGKITQEQADWLIQGLEQGFMPGPGCPGFGFGRRGGHPGGFRGFGGFWGQRNPNSQSNQTNL